MCSLWKRFPLCIEDGWPIGVYTEILATYLTDVATNMYIAIIDKVNAEI